MRISIKPKRLIVRISIISLGVIFLVISYLCFVGVIWIEEFEGCGSCGEYWWSWIINYPPDTCFLMYCVGRNSLYRPLFVVGILFFIGELGYELFLWVKRRKEIKPRNIITRDLLISFGVLSWIFSYFLFDLNTNTINVLIYCGCRNEYWLSWIFGCPPTSGLEYQMCPNRSGVHILLFISGVLFFLSAMWYQKRWRREKQKIYDILDKSSTNS